MRDGSLFLLRTPALACALTLIEAGGSPTGGVGDEFEVLPGVDAQDFFGGRGSRRRRQKVPFPKREDATVLRPGLNVPRIFSKSK